MLQMIIDYFCNSFDFEKYASKIVQILDSNIVDINPTRHTRDDGRDEIGKYRVGELYPKC